MQIEVSYLYTSSSIISDDYVEYLMFTGTYSKYSHLIYRLRVSNCSHLLQRPKDQKTRVSPNILLTTKNIMKGILMYINARYNWLYDQSKKIKKIKN
jgi:hypothetical protein